MAQEGRFTKSSKHVPIYYHFFHKNVDSGYITLAYVPSKDNGADIVTNGLGGQPHTTVATLMRIGDCGNVDECRNMISISSITYLVDLFIIK